MHESIDALGFGKERKMRLTQIIEYLNPSKIPGWPFSHLEVTPGLKRLRAEYRKDQRERENKKIVSGSQELFMNKYKGVPPTEPRRWVEGG